jgi:hypothetical protein
VPDRFSALFHPAAHRLARRWAHSVGCGLIGAFSLAAHAGQTSATVSISVNLVPSTPVSVVTGPSTVVVCGTAAQTGTTECGVITVPPTPGAGGNVPTPASSGGTAGNNTGGGGGTNTGGGTGSNTGGGTTVPVVPTIPPVVAVTPPQTPTVQPASDTLPIARATLELVTLLQTQPERASPTAARDLFLLKDPTPARLEAWRARSVQVFSSGAAERLSNILGTSAEMRIVREVALDYTEMLVGW